MHLFKQMESHNNNNNNNNNNKSDVCIIKLFTC